MFKSIQIKRRSQIGFTLIELLVVIAIVGVLAALLLSNFVGVRERGADAALKNNANQLKTALRLYYNDFQNYPDASGGVLRGCTDGTAACSPGGEFSAGMTTYMKVLPTGFEYYSDGSEEFVIKVALANASDADIAASQQKCDLGSRSGYYDNSQTTENDYVVCED